MDKHQLTKLTLAESNQLSKEEEERYAEEMLLKNINQRGSQREELRPILFPFYAKAIVNRQKIRLQCLVRVSTTRDASSNEEDINFDFRFKFPHKVQKFEEEWLNSCFDQFQKEAMVYISKEMGEQLEVESVEAEESV